MFWFIFFFIFFKKKNFLNLLFTSEIIWVVLYIISIIYGIIYSDLNLLSLSFFILGIAGLEFSIGIILSILYKNTNKSLNLDFNNKITLNLLDNSIKSNIDNIN